MERAKRMLIIREQYIYVEKFSRPRLEHRINRDRSKAHWSHTQIMKTIIEAEGGKTKYWFRMWFHKSSWTIAIFVDFKSSRLSVYLEKVYQRKNAFFLRKSIENRPGVAEIGRNGMGFWHHYRNIWHLSIKKIWSVHRFWKNIGKWWALYFQTAR